MSRSPAGAQRRRPRRRHRLLRQALRHRAGQGAARLRQLRHRRTAAEAGPLRERTARAAPSTTSASRWRPPPRSARRRPGWPHVGLATAVEDGVACCYARQDKVWVDGPSGEPWEIYTVLADVEMPAGQLRTVDPETGAHVLRDRRRGRQPSPPTPPPAAARSWPTSRTSPRPVPGMLGAGLGRRLVAEGIGTGFLLARRGRLGDLATNSHGRRRASSSSRTPRPLPGPCSSLILAFGERVRRPLQPGRHVGRPGLRQPRPTPRPAPTSPPRSSGPAWARSWPT